MLGAHKKRRQAPWPTSVQFVHMLNKNLHRTSPARRIDAHEAEQSAREADLHVLGRRQGLAAQRPALGQILGIKHFVVA